MLAKHLSIATNSQSVGTPDTWQAEQLLQIHNVLGLRIGAPAQQQLHRAIVATRCSPNKRRVTILRRRAPACHRTSSHHRSPTDMHPPRQPRLTRPPARHRGTTTRRIIATAASLLGPPVTPGAARRAANTHGSRTHVVLGLQVGAPVQQQLHRVPVATGCGPNKRRVTILRRRAPACHRTSSHHRSPADTPSLRKCCLTHPPARGARRPNATSPPPPALSARP